MFCYKFLLKSILFMIFGLLAGRSSGVVNLLYVLMQNCAGSMLY